MGLESLTATHESGWLSREQAAANEFARRVCTARGVGLSPAAAAEWRRRKRSARARATGARREEQVGVDGGIAPGEGQREAAGGGVAEEAGAPPAFGREVCGKRGRSGNDEIDGNNDDNDDDDDDDDDDNNNNNNNNKRRPGEEDEAARGIVRDVRRRLQKNGGNEHLEGTPAPPAAADGSAPGTGGGGPARTTEINNADLSEYLRAALPTCSRGTWALLSATRTRIATQRRRAAGSVVSG